MERTYTSYSGSAATLRYSPAFADHILTSIWFKQCMN